MSKNKQICEDCATCEYSEVVFLCFSKISGRFGVGFLQRSGDFRRCARRETHSIAHKTAGEVKFRTQEENWIAKRRKCYVSGRTSPNGPREAHKLVTCTHLKLLLHCIPRQVCASSHSGRKVKKGTRNVQSQQGIGRSMALWVIFANGNVGSHERSPPESWRNRMHAQCAGTNYRRAKWNFPTCLSAFCHRSQLQPSEATQWPLVFN